MPTRYIKESATTSPNLARLSHGAERCFWRLVTKADDYGRFDADPDVVRGGCFSKIAASTEEVSVWLAEMFEAKLIRVYRKNGRRLGYFLAWEKHQGKPRAKESKFPPPPTIARIRGQIRSVVGIGGQVRASAPRIRSSYSESKSSSSSGVSGPQQASVVTPQTAKDNG